MDLGPHHAIGIKELKRDLLGLGWKMHSLDNCVFLLYDNEELIGLCGVYVDDFTIAGRQDDNRWQEAKKKLVNLYTWGKWEKENLSSMRS